MARKAKIDNAILKRLKKQKEKQRKENDRNLRTYILIVCEGEKTEPNYFKGLKQSLPKGSLELRHIDIKGTAHNTISLIEKAQNIRDEEEERHFRAFNEVWAVFDKDDFPDQNFNNAINMGEKAERKINCAWSNEAFELWFLLHFEYLNTGVSRKQYQKKIEEHIHKATGNNNFSYEKSTENMYMLLNEYGNEGMAIKYASKLEEQFNNTNFNYAQHNPCTKVHHLVNTLNALATPPNEP